MDGQGGKESTEKNGVDSGQTTSKTIHRDRGERSKWTSRREVQSIDADGNGEANKVCIFVRIIYRVCMSFWLAAFYIHKKYIGARGNHGELPSPLTFVADLFD